MTKHKCPEAYCMILYSSDKDQEWIWNNRDGPTPLYINSKDGKMMHRVRVGKYRPNKELSEGKRYMVDMTKERAKFLAKQMISKNWHRWKDKAYEGISQKEATFILAKSYYSDGHTATILVKKET